MAAFMEWERWRELFLAGDSAALIAEGWHPLNYRELRHTDYLKQGAHTDRGGWSSPSGGWGNMQQTDQPCPVCQAPAGVPCLKQVGRLNPCVRHDYVNSEYREYVTTQYQRQAKALRRKVRRARRICQDCGMDAAPDRQRCAACLKRTAERRRERDTDKCLDCGQPPAEGKRRCDTHLKAARERAAVKKQGKKSLL